MAAPALPGNSQFRRRLVKTRQNFDYSEENEK
jgi:hypothetical protein